jgi:hypothetical protein
MGAKSPDITMLNAALKRGGIYDGEIWRCIQRLGALRDVWVNASRRDPTIDELTPSSTRCKPSAKESDRMWVALALR